MIKKGLILLLEYIYDIIFKSRYMFTIPINRFLKSPRSD